MNRIGTVLSAEIGGLVGPKPILGRGQGFRVQRLRGYGSSARMKLRVLWLSGLLDYTDQDSGFRIREGVLVGSAEAAIGG